MSWTTPVAPVVGQIAGESSGMFSLNTYVRDNFQWLKDNKANLPVTDWKQWLVDTIYTSGFWRFQVSLSGSVEVGKAGKIEVEIGPADEARSVVAVMGTDDVLAVTEHFAIDFWVPLNSDFKFKKTGDFVIDAYQFNYTRYECLY